MQARCKVPLLQVGSMLALIVVLAGCTKGGQFDPTTMLNNDMFDSKKPLQGQREPVFPNGVPGATTGIPPDLYKGYQPPPDEAADNAAAVTPVVPPVDNAGKAGEKPKAASGKAKVVRTRPKPRTEIKVGLAKHPKAAAQSAPQTSQTAWPAPPAAAQTQSTSTVWPAPPSTNQAQSSQTVWPAPPPAASVQQSSQSIWPNPPATGGSTQ